MSEKLRIEEVPGSPENIAGLARLLRWWRCCGQPQMCGAVCQDDELSAILVAAERVVFQALEAINKKRTETT